MIDIKFCTTCAVLYFGYRGVGFLFFFFFFSFLPEHHERWRDFITLLHVVRKGGDYVDFLCAPLCTYSHSPSSGHSL